MAGIDKLRVVLFALTGFGNPVLEALLQEPRVKVAAVFTVKYDQPFPHYEERQLLELCHERGVTCYYGVRVSSDEGIALLRQHSPDLIIVSTFKQILQENVLSLPRLGVVNFHPSLLPRYRGPCPSNAALYNDEPVTGMTIHYVTDKLDEGNILLQRSLPITATDNDGRLRQKLAKLSGELIPELVDMFANFTKPAGEPQDHRLASFAPKPTEVDGYLEPTAGIDTIRRQMRAFNPLPGASILVGERRVAVDRFDLFRDNRPNGLYETNDAIDVIHASQAIRLYKVR
ncbi:MAG: methionyl-tRNA formyltransferase [Anaerolineales bacterium]|nr:methionyl-tRNA formyltransferase [Anaerolineales bacterium]